MKKIFSLVLCLFFLLPGGLCFADEPDAATADTYFYLDGIEGESKAPDHEKWIDLLTFCYGSSHSQESGSKGIFEPFVFKHLVDHATPKLQDYCMKGTTIKSGKVDFCRQIGGEKKVAYSVTFEGIKVSKAQIEIEDLPDGTFQLVETVEIQVEKQTWTESAPLPEEANIEPGAPMGATELQRIRTLLDEYDQLAQNPAAKEKLDAVQGYTEWIAQIRIRLAELEQEEREKEKKPENENVGSKESKLSPATGVASDECALPVALACIGSAVIGLSVMHIRRKGTK